MNNGTCYGVLLVWRSCNLAQVKISPVKAIIPAFWEAAASHPRCVPGSLACTGCEWNKWNGHSDLNFFWVFFFFFHPEVQDAILPRQIVPSPVLFRSIDLALAFMCRNTVWRVRGRILVLLIGKLRHKKGISLHRTSYRQCGSKTWNFFWLLV